MKIPFLVKAALIIGAGGWALRKVLDTPEGSKGFVSETGVVSWYGPGYEGNLTASGEVFDSSQMTAAHRKLKFGTRVEVTDNDTGRSVVVRINDRGPVTKDAMGRYNRILDLSAEAGRQLGIREKGLARNASIRIL
jgi:rare lipoprotein A